MTPTAIAAALEATDAIARIRLELDETRNCIIDNVLMGISAQVRTAELRIGLGDNPATVIADLRDAVTRLARSAY
jgi:hypothetical protein